MGYLFYQIRQDSGNHKQIVAYENRDGNPALPGIMATDPGTTTRLQ